MREDGRTTPLRGSVPTELVARLEVAEAPCRELDAEIGRAFGGQVVARFGDYDWRAEGVGIWRALPMFTRSLDDTLALTERMLPGAGWNIRRNDWGVTAEVYPYEPDTRTEAQKLGFSFITYEPKAPPFGSARTPALALCIAILKATTPGKPSSASEGVGS